MKLIKTRPIGQRCVLSVLCYAMVVAAEAAAVVVVAAVAVEAAVVVLAVAEECHGMILCVHIVGFSCFMKRRNGRTQG